MSAKGVKTMHRLVFIRSFVVLPVDQPGIKLFPKTQIHIITVTWGVGGEYKQTKIHTHICDMQTSLN
jgi:hypothetical protein